MIRPYEAADRARVAEIHDAARRIELALAGLEDAFLPFEIAAEREDFYGFSAYTDEELAWLYVDPARFRTGIGRSLVQHALQVEPDICCIEALCGNEPARQLYERFGFSVDEIVEGRMPGNESFHVKVYSMNRK